MLLVASNDDRDEIESQVGNISRNWQRPGVAADLASVAASEPFQCRRCWWEDVSARAYTAGATILTDDRMALEFSRAACVAHQQRRKTALRLVAVRRFPHSSDEPGNRPITGNAAEP